MRAPWHWRPRRRAGSGPSGGGAAAPTQRTTSLRTRSFVVIIIAVLIPSMCLAALGVWVYFRTWDHAATVYTGQARGQALEVFNEINELSTMPARYSPAERALLSQAIVTAYGNGQTYGASMDTLDQIGQQQVLPAWAVAALSKNDFAIGDYTGPTPLDRAAIIAWRVGPTTVRYYTGWYSDGRMPVHAPLGRVVPIALLSGALILVLGLLGAWVLSRSVVRPVRRLAEASGRLAEGERDVAVTPEGPRELRELAASFNDMNTKLTKAQEAEQSFLLSVSHELKTPLTSIRGYAEGLGDGTIKAKAGSAVIGSEAGRLERLVGDLLDSARMRKSAFTVRRETIDLAALADDVARRYESTAREAGLTLLLKTAGGGTALADSDRVLQAVSNLVENAIRCTPPPGTVTITTAPGSVTVSDTGRGLTGDDLPRAFERFYLYDRYGNDRPVGTGLGLAIVKELTEAMGGTIRVASAVGVGTAFSISLPHDGVSPTPIDAELPTHELPALRNQPGAATQSSTP
jgi:signal transduction histidine kinase